MTLFLIGGRIRPTSGAEERTRTISGSRRGCASYRVEALVGTQEVVEFTSSCSTSFFGSGLARW
jgi:hypothetical protein